jgi:xyloglucan 6-xylosyltransferase
MEWIWWLDADAVFTDMLFLPPLSELEHHNLVLQGDRKQVYPVKDWQSVGTANFLIRNCQWSLNLLDAWGSMGTNSIRQESGTFLNELLLNRPSNLSGDVQSSMVAMLAQDQKNRHADRNWTPRVKLVNEKEYVMNGNWTYIAPRLEDLVLDDDNGVPFVTHFQGCLPGCKNQPDQLLADLLDTCTKQLERAFDFAENQVSACASSPNLPASYVMNA